MPIFSRASCRGSDGAPSPKPISLGIVGTGEIVRMVLPALKNDLSIRVDAITGTNGTAAAVLAKELGGAKVCTEYRELLELDLDAVFIATPPYLHCEMIEAALLAGKHVVCEKPFVMNLAELRGVAAIHEMRPHLKLASCSSRFQVGPPVRKAREMIAQGRLGKLLSVRLNNSIELPRPLSSLPAWKRRSETSGGGLLMDWGVYDLDWLQFLLGEWFAPTAVMGSVGYWRDEETRLETSYTAQIQCEWGLTISLERRPEHGPYFQRIEIRGTEGGLDLPFMPGGKPEHLVHYRRGHNGALAEEALSERMVDWDTILAFPVIDLARALQGDREVASALSKQYKIYSVIAAIYKSAERKAARQSCLT